jgi:superfamily II DNA/RNA helicase
LSDSKTSVPKSEIKNLEISPIKKKELPKRPQGTESNEACTVAGKHLNPMLLPLSNESSVLSLTNRLSEMLKERGSGIIFCRRKEDTSVVASLLNNHGISCLFFFVVSFITFH